MAYQVGEYHIAKNGEMTGPDDLGTMVALLERGFEPEPSKTFHLITPRGTLLIQERFDTAAEAEAAGYGNYFHHEGRDVYTKDSGKEYCPFFALVGAPFEENERLRLPEEAPEPEAEPAGVETEPAGQELDEVVIEMPLDGFTPAALENLCKMVTAKEELIKLAIGAQALPIACGPMLSRGISMTTSSSS
jgi:hypothetical protein